MHSNGALRIEQRENFFQHASQWTHYDGYGGYRDDANVVGDFAAPKDQARGRRWSYLPWTKEQEESCRDGREDGRGGKTGLKLKVRLWNSAFGDEDASDGTRRSKRSRTE